MSRVTRIFRSSDRIRPGWRFAIFLLLYFAGGKLLDFVLPFDRSFTWSSLLLNEASDFALVAGAAWLMSRIERERFSSYGLPLFRGAGPLFVRGVVWGIVPSILILIPIYLAGACSFHGWAQVESPRGVFTPRLSQIRT